MALPGGFGTYEVEFNTPVDGLTKAAEVHFNGIKVGEVTGLRLGNAGALGKPEGAQGGVADGSLAFCGSGKRNRHTIRRWHAHVTGRRSGWNINGSTRLDRWQAVFQRSAW